MIVLPRVDEMQGAEWSPADAAGGSFLTGSAAPLPLGSFRLPDAPHLLAPAPTDDDPVVRADTMRARAGQVFQRQRAIGAFNRDLDSLSTTIAEGTDWSEGLSKYDKELGALRQKHLAALRTPEDRAALEAHADAFAAMQRIGLKRALTERQQADALALLDDQLAYYADKAAQAPNEVFRQIATEAGERAIEELRDAGYLFPEGADRRKQAFLGRIDGADLESIVQANPEEALGILDNPALFPNVDAATRAKLKFQLLPALYRPGEPPPEIRTMERRQDDPKPQTVPFGAAADGEDAPSASEPQHGIGVGDHEIPLNAESADESDSEAGVRPSTQDTSAAEPQTPGTWQALLGQLLNMDLGRQQGLTPHDLTDAKPLPDELAKYNLKPGEATEATINELLPLLRADARKLGLDVIVRWDPSTGGPGFAVRPQGSSAHVVEGDGALAKGLNRTAEVAYALGSMLGLNFGGSAPGAVATGARVANALKTGRAADEGIVSAGGVGGPSKGSGHAAPSKANIAAKSADEIAAAEREWAEKGFKIGDFGPVFDDLRGKWKEGVQRLLKEQNGEVPGALRHPEIAEGIDLIWGKAGTGASDGYGLAKIAKYHPEVMANLQDVVENTNVISRSPNRIILESPDHRVLVSLEFLGEKKTWLLTAYQKHGSALRPADD